MRQFKRIILTALLLLLTTAAAWALPSIHLAGNGSGNWLSGQAWNPSSNEMDYNDGIYSITFQNVAAGTSYNFKFCQDGSWTTTYGISGTGTVPLEASLPSDGNENIFFNLSEAADVTISFRLDDFTFMISTKGVLVGQEKYVPTQQEDLSWKFNMPAGNRALRLGLMQRPGLAWYYDGEAIPAEGLTLYRGFERAFLETADGNSRLMFDCESEEFLDALIADEPTVSVRIGSTDESIVVIDLDDPDDLYLKPQSAGQCYVYMVFDGDDDFACDSVAYLLTVADPYTLRFEANPAEGGAVETGDNVVTWSNMGVTGYGAYTQDGVTLTPSNGDAHIRGNFYDYGDNTFTTTLGNFVKIEITCTYPGNDMDGWTKEVAGRYQPHPDEDPDEWETIYKLTWTGDAESVTVHNSIFGIQSVTFTISNPNIADNGDGSYTVLPGTQVVAQATANEGYYLAGWSAGNADDESLTDTIIVAEDMTLTATFDTMVYALSVQVADGQEMMGGVESEHAAVKHFLDYEVSASPNYGYLFKEWTDLDGNVLSTEDTYTFSPVSDTTLVAHFVVDTFTLTLTSNNSDWGVAGVQGEGVVNNGDGTYRVPYLTRLTVSAEASALHHVVYWYNEGGDTLADAVYSDYFVTDPAELFPAVSQLTFTLTCDTAVNVLFGINSYDVAANVGFSSDTRGTVHIRYTDVEGNAQATEAGAAAFASAQGGSVATLVAQPVSSCYDFDHWMVGEDELTTDTITVGEAATATAYFTLHVYTGDTVADECDQFTWHGETYTEVPAEAPTFVYLTEADACDSTVTLHLTLRYANSGDTTAVSCDSYDWYEYTGVTASTESLTHLLEGANAAGCDSTVTLHLTINYQNRGEESLTVCDSYTWEGTPYTVSGDYTKVLANRYACDSTTTLHLTVNYHHDTAFNDQATGRYVWGRGQGYEETFTENGTYVRTIATYQGCDSTVTLTLAIASPATPIPEIYTLMNVALIINHFPDSVIDKVDYIYYRWYRNGQVVKEGVDADNYDEGGNQLDGCYYLEISTDAARKHWAKSNEMCFPLTGIADVETVDFSLMPNPAVRGQHVTINVEGSTDLQGARLTVFDATGRKAMEQTLAGGFDAKLPAGVYMLRLTLRDGRTATKRLVVR